MKSWAERELDNPNLRLFLIAIITMGLLPFIGELPTWLMTAAGAVMVWNFLSLRPEVKFIPRHTPRWLRNSLALLTAVAVFSQYHTLAGQDAATAFLVLLAGFKILESVRYRDAMILIFVAYFLLMDAALFSQSLSMTIYLVFDLMVITVLLFYLHGRDRLLSIRSLKAVAKVLAVALPLCFIMFFLFPRFSAELFKISSPSSGGTGFSDDLNPGDLENLAQSDVLAFRATFLKTTPHLDQLYWRGGILTKSEGIRWTRPPSRPFRSIHAAPDAADITQEIVLEPLFKKFVFALDVPTSITLTNNKAHFAFPREGTIFERDTDATTRILYTAHSQLATDAPVVTELGRVERVTDLQAPEMSARDRKLVDSFTSPKANARQLAERVLTYYKQQHFRYTLEPGAMPGGIDQFLFEKKIGFCEHYAASFATIMRWLGVPARVVIGFEGGNYNSLGGYYIVSSLDAHAWAEIWSDADSRWVRIDPTGKIAPMRITLGSNYYNADPSLLQSGITREDYENSIQAHFLSRWLSRSRLAFDLVSSRWNGFMLRYDFDYQTDLLRKLGITGSSRAILFLWLFLAGGLFLFLGQLWMRRSRKTEDPLLRAYNDLCEGFARKGLARQPNEGPLDYLQRLIVQWPNARTNLEALMRDFISLRYQVSADGAWPDFYKRAKEWQKEARLLLRTPQLFKQ